MTSAGIEPGTFKSQPNTVTTILSRHLRVGSHVNSCYSLTHSLAGAEQPNRLHRRRACPSRFHNAPRLTNDRPVPLSTCCTRAQSPQYTHSSWGLVKKLPKLLLLLLYNICLYAITSFLFMLLLLVFANLLLVSFFTFDLFPCWGRKVCQFVLVVSCSFLFRGF